MSETLSAKEAKIKIFTISFDVLSIEKCILCDKAAKQQQQLCNCGLLPGGTDKRPASSFYYSGKKFACLPKDDVNDDNATHVLPLPGDVYEEGPLIQTRVFRSVSLTLTDGGQA